MVREREEKVAWQIDLRAWDNALGESGSLGDIDKCHSSGYLQILVQIRAYLVETLEKKSIKKIIFTGHLNLLTLRLTLTVELDEYDM